MNNTKPDAVFDWVNPGDTGFDDTENSDDKLRIADDSDTSWSTVPGCLVCVRKHIGAAVCAYQAHAIELDSALAHADKDTCRLELINTWTLQRILYVGHMRHAAYELYAEYPGVASELYRYADYMLANNGPELRFEVLIAWLDCLLDDNAPLPIITPTRQELFGGEVYATYDTPGILVARVMGHLADAMIWSNEVQLGYPNFMAYVIGALDLASTYALSLDTHLAAVIREHRLTWERTADARWCNPEPKGIHSVPYVALFNYIRLNTTKCDSDLQRPRLAGDDKLSDAYLGCIEGLETAETGDVYWTMDTR